MQLWHPAGGAYSTPPDLLADFKGTLRSGEGRGKGKGEDRKGKEERIRSGRGKGRLTLMRSWNRAAGWLQSGSHDR